MYALRIFTAVLIASQAAFITPSALDAAPRYYAGLRPAQVATHLRPAGSVESVLFSFGSLAGQYASSGLLMDAGGNLYGETVAGGKYNAGAIFRLQPPAPGQTAWREVVLHSFTGRDGEYPTDDALIADPNGALYGSTTRGGAYGGGTVFRLEPPAPGKTGWSSSVLHSFPSGNTSTDGSFPQSGLLADSAGNLYGTTAQGGGSQSSSCYLGCGVVFKLTPPAAGKSHWNENVLHVFGLLAGDGGAPSYGHLIGDATGSLYGTTSVGGAQSSADGTIYKLAPPSRRQSAWTETILHSFPDETNNPNDGYYPYAGLIADRAGALYGTTSSGGNANAGTVFRLSPPAPGQSAWTSSTLYSFLNEPDGAAPGCDLIADAGGSLYGTTPNGGLNNGPGTIFKLTSPPPGQTLWTESVLYEFAPSGDAFRPSFGLVADANGTLYGTSYYGGKTNNGAIFALSNSGFALARARR